MDASDPLRNLPTLYAKVAAHGDRVMATYPKAFACKAGCSGCCDSDRKVSAVEHANVKRAFDALSPQIQDKLKAQPASKKRCSMLLNDRCAVYEARPLICRSHGLPVVLERAKGKRVLDVCPLNFTDGSAAQLPFEDVLNVGTIDSILTAVNLLYCQEAGGDPRKRQALRTLLEG